MKRIPRPYVDRGTPGRLRYNKGGRLLLVKEPPSVPEKILTLQALRRHNTLQPALQPTHRLLLRWGEGGGSGLPNTDADVREVHYDPLPPDQQKKIDALVDGSPWELLTRRWYRTALGGQELADEFGISRTQLYADWRASLWYFRGRFEGVGLYE